jgi:hypothetical protein
MFEVIAVPVDGSDYGYKAADVAIEIAKKIQLQNRSGACS